MSLLLEGKRAFISGGTRGIGAALCEVFAREGADVAFNYNSRDDLADVSDDSRALRRVKQSLEAFFGAVDEIEEAVRTKLRNKAPGSRDYDVLYQKFYHDEMVRRNL